jgi:hypothetical protein
LAYSAATCAALFGNGAAHQQDEEYQESGNGGTEKEDIEVKT